MQLEHSSVPGLKPPVSFKFQVSSFEPVQRAEAAVSGLGGTPEGVPPDTSLLSG